MTAIGKNECPLQSILQILTGSWTTTILWQLKCNGPLRFGELKRNILGISSKVLTQRLRFLESERVIYRKSYGVKVLKVSYGLTQRGEELGLVCKSLNELAMSWNIETETAEPNYQSLNLLSGLEIGIPPNSLDTEILSNVESNSQITKTFNND